MYNRYVPQADGSFRRSRIQEPINQRERSVNTPPPIQEAAQREKAGSQFSAPKRNDIYPQRNGPPVRSSPHNDNNAASVGSFLKGLLPSNFDTEDLMVILLLLLMSGNSGSDQNAALMTLVIYLFL